MTEKMVDDKMTTDKMVDDKSATDEMTAAKVIGDARTAGRVAAGCATGERLRDAPAPGDAPPADPSSADPCAASRLWVGFIELEAWAEAIDPARPALLLPVVRASDNDGPFQSEDLLVCCQQVTPEGDVLCCLLRSGTLTRVFGEIVETDWRFRAMAWESLWECVEEVLTERGLSVVAATVALPPTLPLPLGHARGVRYDKLAQRFRRVRPA